MRIVTLAVMNEDDAGSHALHDQAIDAFQILQLRGLSQTHADRSCRRRPEMRLNQQGDRCKVGQTPRTPAWKKSSFQVRNSQRQVKLFAQRTARVAIAGKQRWRSRPVTHDRAGGDRHDQDQARDAAGDAAAAVQVRKVRSPDVEQHQRERSAARSFEKARRNDAE